MTERKRKTISASVNTELYKKLKELSESTDIPVSRLLDKGIEYIIKKHETPHN